MTQLLNEDEVIERLRNANIKKLYEEFSKNTDLRVRFEQLRNRSRAENEYNCNSDEFIIRLRKDWRENDLAHELLLGELMFIEKYGIILCERPVCQLLRDYIEDMIVHSKLFKEIKINPIDEKYISDRNLNAEELVKGEILINEYWDERGVICKILHKSLLYVQAYHLSKLLMTTDLDRFLVAFNKAYNGKKELEIARRIHGICNKNKWLNSKENYESALVELKKINFLEIKEVSIKHYTKHNVGFILT